MAYGCVKSSAWKECDGCMDCRPKRTPETGVIITAKIELKFTAYGEIERLLRSGNKAEAGGMAEALVDDIIDCCGLAGQDMSVENIEYELNE